MSVALAASVSPIGQSAYGRPLGQAILAESLLIPSEERTTIAGNQAAEVAGRVYMGNVG